ncbi:hypothetical protein D3C73_1326080 [compost metagenome]
MLFKKNRQHFAGSTHDGGGINGKNTLPLIILNVACRFKIIHNPGVIHQYIDGAVSLDNGIYQILNIFLYSDIGLNDNSFPAVGLNFLHRSFCRIFINVGDDDLCTFPGVQNGNCLAHPRSGSRYHSYFILQSHLDSSQFI